MTQSETMYYRSIFISDVHLGTSECQSHYLLNFLEKVHCENLYLVGDIIDLIGMSKKACFPHSHQKVIEKFIDLAEQGVNVTYVPGNHDALFRRFCGQTIAKIKIQHHALHQTANNRIFYISHGDEFDQLVRCHPALLKIGDKAHAYIMRLNQWLNESRRYLNMPYWSFAAYIKSHTPKAQAFIERFEEAALNRAKHCEVDGYICGHIHSTGFRKQDSQLYCNDGDWVEHCTALVEDESGQMSILHCTETITQLMHENRCKIKERIGWTVKKDWSASLT